MLLSATNVQLHSSRHEWIWLHSCCVCLMHCYICLLAFMLSWLVSFHCSEPRWDDSQCRGLKKSLSSFPCCGWRNTLLMKTLRNKSQQSCIKSLCVPKGNIPTSPFQFSSFQPTAGILGARRKWGRLNLLDLLSQHVSAVCCCVIVQLSVEP